MTNKHKTPSDRPLFNVTEPYRVILIDGTTSTEQEIKLPPNIPMPYFGVGDYRLRIDKAGVIVGAQRRFLVVEAMILATTNHDSLPGTRRAWVTAIDGRASFAAGDYINQLLTDGEKMSVRELFKGKQEGATWREASVTLYDYGYAIHKAAEFTIGREVMATFWERPVRNSLHPDMKLMMVKWTRTDGEKR